MKKVEKSFLSLKFIIFCYFCETLKQFKINHSTQIQERFDPQVWVFPQIKSLTATAEPGLIKKGNKREDKIWRRSVSNEEFIEVEKKIEEYFPK